eukprot:UN21419
MKPFTEECFSDNKIVDASMVYQSIFVIKMHFQSQYTYTFILKIHTHLQCHHVYHIRVSECQKFKKC